MEAREGAAERERLRRALYREGAGEADRERYARAALPEDAPLPPAPVEHVRRRPLAAPVAVLGGVLAVAGLLAWPVAAGPAPSTTRSASAVRTPPPIGFVLRPDARPTSITYTDAGVVQQFHGRGPATALLDGDVMPHDGGRLSVVLAPSETALIRWEVRRAVPADGVSDQLIASRSVTEQQGVAEPIVFPFVGGPPTTVRVRTADDVAWSLVVTSLRGATAR